MTYADEVDVGICGGSVKTSGQFDSSFVAKSALLVFLIVPSPWKRAGSQFVLENFPQVNITTLGDSQTPPKQYLTVNYQLSILVVWEGLLHVRKC